jgi:energy-coupling factor transporter ATP-binding protein EcfA2
MMSNHWVILGEAVDGFKCNQCKTGEAKWVVQNSVGEKKVVCDVCLQTLGAVGLASHWLRCLETLVNRFKEAGLSTKRFVKLAARGKDPVMEKGFYENLLEPGDLIIHLLNGGNYGIAAGGGLVLVEADGEPLASALASRFKTFTVLSGGHKMPHFYFAVDDLPADLNDKIPLVYGMEQASDGRLVPHHIGVVIIKNGYLVGPGSIHPSGGLYTIGLGIPIARVSWRDLLEVLRPFMLETFHEARGRVERASERERKLNISIEKVLEVYGVKGLKKSGEQLYGPHPIHGSTTGRNFWVHIEKGVWYCFRCQSGGGPVTLLAVLEGLISCDEARKGLNGELYRKALEKAIERGLLGREVLNGLDAGGVDNVDLSGLDEYAEAVKSFDFYSRVNTLVENIEKLLQAVKPDEVDPSGWFRKLRMEDKTAILTAALKKLFKFVYIPPLGFGGESNIYVLDDGILYDVDEVILRIIGALVERGLAKRSLEAEVEAALYSTTQMVPWSQVDPWDYLKLKDGVLDLNELKLVDSSSYCFRYRLDISITDDELKEIKDGSYKVEENPIYKYWRSHFDDKNWEYLVSGLGTWLAPFRSKFLGFLVGPKDSGKSTLLENLTRPIRPIVAFSSLRNLTGYTFGLEDLIGKQLNVYAERSEIVLKNLDIINNLVGGHDFINVPRKFKTSTVIRSLKAMFFSMNDPPILFEYGGETLRAFLGRLSLIEIRKPENFKPIPNLSVEPVEAFKFLLWCRKKLEDDNWEIKKMDEEEMLDYLTSMTNTALRFLESEYVVEDTSGKVKGMDLYDSYVKWCKEKGITPMGLQNFYTTVSSKYTKFEKHKTIYFKGLRLLSPTL